MPFNHMPNPTKSLVFAIGFIILSAILILAAFALPQTATACTTAGCPQPCGTTSCSCADGVTLNPQEFVAARDAGQITMSGIAVNSSALTATFNIQNSTGCAAPISMASYKMFDRQLSTQQLFSQTGPFNLAANSSKTMTVNLPSCMAQIDAFYGTAPAHLSDGNPYGYPSVPFIIAVDFYQNNGSGYADASGNFCTIPVPDVICSPATQNANVNQSVAMYASGGNGTYAWSAEGGYPASGSSNSFNTSYSTSGTKTVTVQSGGKTAQCQVVVSNPIPTLTCNPANQTVNVGDIASVSASGGIGNYSWSAAGGNPASGTGSNFSTSYATSGSKTVTVTAGTQTQTCYVTVQNPICILPTVTTNAATNITTNSAIIRGSNSGTVAIITFQYGTDPSNLNQTASPVGTIPDFYAQLGNLQANTTYYFRFVGTNSCGTRYGIILSFKTNFNPTAPSCVASPQSVTTSQTVNFTGSGGEGTFNWSIPGGTPATGSGATLPVTFATQGTKTATVTSAAGLSATCTVVVSPVACTVPTVTTNAATNVTQTSATLQGTVTNATSNYRFDYGTDPNNLNQSISASLSGSTITATLSGLQSNRLYYFRASADNSCGNTAGAILSFTTGQLANTPSCYATPQYVSVNDVVNVYGTGGDNSNYTWTVLNGIPSYGAGQYFTTRFTQPGTQIITVISSGQTSQCIVTVNQNYQPPYYPPYQPPYQPVIPGLQITKAVRNITAGQLSFVQSVEVSPLDQVEFEIRVRNTSNMAEPISVRDALPPGLLYIPGSAQASGLSAEGITYSDLSLGNVSPSQEVIIRFRANVAGNIPPGFLTNQATATSGSLTQTAFATVSIRPVGQVLGAADIITGPEDTLPIATLVGLFAAGLCYWLIYRRKEPQTSGISAWYPAPVALPESMNKNQVTSLIEKIRQAEKHPDTAR